MERKVYGAGMLFVGSGCGPALSPAQQEFLSKVIPSEWYPAELLFEMLAAAEARDPKIVTATARRWASALKPELEKQGCATTQDFVHRLSDIFREHHQGDMGSIGIEETGPRSFNVTNGTPYPDLLMTALVSWFPSACGADEVEVTPTGRPHAYAISWTEE